MKKNDFTQQIFLATTHTFILFFSNRGQVYTLRGYQIPEAGRRARGSAMINLLPLDTGEKITGFVTVSAFEENKFLFMATNRGTVKRTRLAEFSSVRKNGLKAMNLHEGEELIRVKVTDGSASIVMATRKGMAIHFREQDVRCMGRGNVAMDAATDRDYDVLTVTEKGKGKRTAVHEYALQTRGGKGRLGYKVTQKTGFVADMAVVHPQDGLYVISAKGKRIRKDVNRLPQYARVTQGVYVMRLREAVFLPIGRIHREDVDAADALCKFIGKKAKPHRWTPSAGLV